MLIDVDSYAMQCLPSMQAVSCCIPFRLLTAFAVVDVSSTAARKCLAASGAPQNDVLDQPQILSIRNVC